MRHETGSFQDALRPLSRAKSMPADFYTSDTVFQSEREKILLKHWFFVGREEQWEGPGAYRAIETVGGPVVVIRSEDGHLRAFVNACRHRGSLLLEGEGKCGRIVCPYHAWSYLSDGTLFGCPDMKDAEGFDRIENGLIPIRLETWAGFVFLNYDQSAVALLEALGDFPDRMASHQLDEMRFTWNRTFDCDCNWKLLLENAMETYHTGVVHRDTVGAQTSRTLRTRGDWLCIQVLSDRSIATLPGDQPTLPAIGGLDADAQQGTYFTVIHPTCQFVVAQDCMWWLNVLPVSPGRSILEVGGCFPQASISLANFEHLAEPYYRRWAEVALEDVQILEKQQRGLTNVAYRPGALSGRDDQVQALGRWVLERLPEFSL